MTYFHVSVDDLGGTFIFDSGGYYEKTDDYGTVEQRNPSGIFAGYLLSDVPELAASKSPEAALLAQLKNVADDLPGITEEYDVTLHVYRVDQEPDIDLTNNCTGDFSLIEEVRYRNPESNPVHGERVTSVTVSGKVVGDVDLVYLPENPHIIREWGEVVKESLREVVEGNTYTEPAERGVAQPDISAYGY